ncbi:short-chain dehydrogenase/reductase [Jannaschia pagri]|uniref:Short-chain dehydrogenase/reductase n=1 Tax=Jannaschia pagri TaxID=2829797 RepID=A0ABQ4NGV7_9RHOB|nr:MULTISPECIES: SDR family NAD(P)-dependent oxidoreductase [unclassified Jannaschia]GIT90240.1 short-chain dehydrogenase/reductase [Jannaschia sp. AI_61]GIT93654.1 short-chain dehydrogenase/reductase [Jannaschia sp. AI_62]
MAKRSILITGCSSGIGLDAAKTLRARGWTVFASCRKEEDCQRLRAEGFLAPLLDYEDEDTIQAALAEALEATGGTLDAIFNNGAYAIPGLVEDLPTPDLRRIFEANFFGWHTLTRAVIPVMRAQGHGRIVQNSSVLGFAAAPWRGAYNATKFAVEGLTDTLRMEMAGSGIHVSLIEPGPITSAFRKNARREFEATIDWQATARASDYEKAITRLGSTDRARFELPPSAVTAKLIHAIESPRPHPRYYVTVPTHLGGLLKRALPTRALDRLLRNS